MTSVKCDGLSDQAGTGPARTRHYDRGSKQPNLQLPIEQSDLRPPHVPRHLALFFFCSYIPGRVKTGGDTMSEDGGGDDFAVPRDAGGRYVPGISGNPAGKPRGCLNRATRLAAALLE